MLKPDYLCPMFVPNEPPDAVYEDEVKEPTSEEKLCYHMGQGGLGPFSRKLPFNLMARNGTGKRMHPDHKYFFEANEELEMSPANMPIATATLEVTTDNLLPDMDLASFHALNVEGDSVPAKASTKGMCLQGSDLTLVKLKLTATLVVTAEVPQRRGSGWEPTTINIPLTVQKDFCAPAVQMMSFYDVVVKQLLEQCIVQDLERMLPRMKTQEEYTSPPPSNLGP